MSTDHRELLKNIRTFPSLIKYLRDELDWPISSDDFEELTYDYTPEELGIDSKNAAKIQEIKRLRPLSVNQPWGIFFVKFEPKRLPVAALRRILSRVVVKKRASANSAERVAWQVDDLLFVSNYGEGEERRINLAHFTHDKQSNLPTLKVLGWDNLDTPLHLDHVADVLNEKLTWPEDEGDVELWRETWRSAFTLKHREVITTSKTLAIKLAELARGIRNRINAVLAIETEYGPVTKLMKAFQEALIHDLDEDGFADMYAQTIAYGLLSARIANPGGDTSDDIATQLPITNPFLKELMETFLDVGRQKGTAGSGMDIDFDELGVSEVVELLDDANMEAVLMDFGDRSPQEDPVIHFYELFLKEYDAKKRMQRGVFYTPRPVVSYIVRSVDELLRTEFGLEDGLGDTTTWGEMAERHSGLEIPEGIPPDQAFVQILDPATGTGTFLVEVIDLIHKTMAEKWRREGRMELELPGLWNEYIPENLLPRLHGYELMMAPYAIAHMKIGLKLHETGYRFESDERAGIYLTNALEPVLDTSQHELEGILPALAHEATAVNEIKQNQRFTVVIGNPPYSGHSANTGKWITDRVHDYYYVDGKPLGERNPKWLQDDYVKFIRLGQFCIQQTSYGILGFITNHGYLENPTFRGMRQSMLKTFLLNYVVDLHGNVKKGSQDSSDQNVFNIQQGVAIGIWTRLPWEHLPVSLYHGELIGDRGNKYSQLLDETVTEMVSSEVHPVSPFYLFFPQSEKLRDEFALYPSLQDIFQQSIMGITTGRDRLCISITSKEAMIKLEDFASDLPEAELASKYGLSNKSGWNIKIARKRIRRSGISQDNLQSIAYRPFDNRTLYLDSAIVGRPRLEVMRNMLGGNNIALCTTRQVNAEFRHVLCTRLISNDCFVSLASGERTYSFPLFLKPDPKMLIQFAENESNLVQKFYSDVTAVTEHQSSEAQSQSLSKNTPENAFNYVYAILHSWSYRSRYSEFLRIEFPRIPIPGSSNLFNGLSVLGGELVDLHLLESRTVSNFITNYKGPINPKVERIGWSDGVIWLDASKTSAHEGHRATEPGTIGFLGVPEEVWDFHIGGYRVCHKWLKDRKGRTLSEDDLSHYQKIVVALNETIRIMQEIDEVIEAHGGWPDAFSVSDEQL